MACIFPLQLGGIVPNVKQTIRVNWSLLNSQETMDPKKETPTPQPCLEENQLGKHQQALMCYTPQTNESALKRGHFKKEVVFQPLVFRGQTYEFWGGGVFFAVRCSQGTPLQSCETWVGSGRFLKCLQGGPLQVINGVITLLIGVISPFITCRGPPCGESGNFRKSGNFT